MGDLAMLNKTLLLFGSITAILLSNFTPVLAQKPEPAATYKYEGFDLNDVAVSPDGVFLAMIGKQIKDFKIEPEIDITFSTLLVIIVSVR
jgi:hypothetical protein